MIKLLGRFAVYHSIKFGCTFMLSKYFLHVKLLLRGANVTIFKFCLYVCFEMNKTGQKCCKSKVSLKSVN